MPAADLFETLLAAKLEAPAEPPVAGPYTIRTEPFSPAGVFAFGALNTGSGAPPRRWELRSARENARVTRRTSVSRLSPAQRDALTALRRLGAALAEDFDAGQLKAAFRRLALQLHPDRHPGADSDRRRWLGTRFAVLCEAYRTLSEPLPHP